MTRLLCGTPTPGDSLRYGGTAGRREALTVPQAHYKPVVVWNVTRHCNLFCAHCYTASNEHTAPDELTTREAYEVAEDLTAFGVPVILFSGGEPLLREDVFQLMKYVASLGIQPVLSSNGTLLAGEVIPRLLDSNVTRVGISLDGLESTNDRFRGKVGAFREALEGIRRSVAAGFRVSLRFTMTVANSAELDAIFALAEQEGVHRLCIYHLAYAGRGRGLLPQDLNHQQRREAVERVFQHTLDIHQRRRELEVLTVDNHADGPYLLLWAQRHRADRVAEILRLLSSNGGNSAGKGIACIDERGFVYPDPFWRRRSRRLGNVRERLFSEIWQDESILLLGMLRNRSPYLSERCRTCQFLPLCNGNLRARAEASSGDPWGDDPACYLTDDERLGSTRMVKV